jgi:hypothetical protein
LRGGNAVDEQEDIVAVVAVVGVDAKLADDFKGVLAPVANVDEHVIERRAVVAREPVAVTKRVGGGENVGSDDFVEWALEFVVGELDVVDRLEFPAEIFFRRSAVPDVRALLILQVAKRLDKLFFKLAFR